MKILYISHRIPYPPNKGDKLRMFYTIRHLSRQHQIDVVSFIDSAAERIHIGELKKYCRAVTCLERSLWLSYLYTAWYLGKKLPVSLGHFYAKTFKKLVREHLKNNKYDLIIVFSSTMAQYVADYHDCPKILDLVDADSEKWFQYAGYASPLKAFIYRLEGKRLRAYEQEIAKYFNVCTVVTGQEKKILREIIPAEKLKVVKNGFNLLPQHDLSFTKSTPPALLFIGGMFYFAYIDGILHFYKNSLPLIKKQFPDVKLYIVGADPSPTIRRLAQTDNQVIVTGHVPEVLPYLEKAWVYIVPLRMAPGLQNKILEAMACSLPVVATSAAVSGIEAAAGHDLLVADDPGEFAQSVVKLLQDSRLRQEIGGNGRKLVEGKYDWNVNLQEFDKIITGLGFTTKRGNFPSP
ncbi:MAG: TIGR03087 family PEP-CTERM/XrtA system glycosyltransferase [Candidatus Schekmanbacteria bacterium]|nr:TIGR03087 family PEP-CTERM/XrtA system glycosyltransferase [Candidatus Schekmanbacteria bacterium]